MWKVVAASVPLGGAVIIGKTVEEKNPKQNFRVTTRKFCTEITSKFVPKLHQNLVFRAEIHIFLL